MALSGSATAYSGNSHYKIEIDWSATQNVAGNYSTVTADLWFWSDSSWDISVSNHSGYIQIDGTTYNFTYSLNSSGGKWVKMYSASKTVYHNSDGTKSLTVKGNYNFGITISGSALGSPVATYSGSLDTIPRASSVSSTVSWTAGTQNLSISVTSASSGFTHLAQVYIQTPSGTWNYIGETPSYFSTSTTLEFNSTHITRMYQAITQYENRPAKIVLYTYSGSTQIGTSEKLGTVYGVAIGKASFSDFNIGDNVALTVSPVYQGFTYTAVMTFGGFSKTWSLTTPTSGSSLSATLTFAPADITSMYAQVPNSNVGTGNLKITTQYNGVDVNDGAPAPAYDPNKSFNAYVVNSNPTFSGTGVLYLDTNSVTAGLTGAGTAAASNYMIQNKSKLQVQIPLGSKATAINGATMARYEAAIAGKVVPANFSSSAQVNIDVNEIDISSDTTMQLYAVDSRGNKTPVPITVKGIPYANPTMITSVSRANSFDTQTTITLSGSASPLTISGANKNSIVSISYEYKVSGTADTSYVAITPVPTASGFPSYTGTSKTITLAIDNAYDVRITVTDRIGPVSVVKSVSAGIPLMFIDSVKKSVGIGKLPTSNNSLEVAGTLMVDGGISLGSALTMNGGASLKYGTAFTMEGGTNNNYAIQQWVNTDNRFIMAPKINGTWDWNKEFGFDANNGRWYVDSDLLVDSSLVLGKTGSGGTTSQIVFPAASGGNDPGYIKHIESPANTAIMQFSVSDDAVGTDYFSFGSTPSNVYKEAFRISTDGHVDVRSDGGMLRLYGTTHGYLQFYVKNSDTTRSGYFGYGSGNSNELSLANEIGGITINPLSTSQLTLNMGISGGVMIRKSGTESTAWWDNGSKSGWSHWQNAWYLYNYSNARFEACDYNGGITKKIAAYGWDTISSAKWKKDIRDFDGSAKDIIKGAKVRKYKYDEKQGFNDKNDKIGLIAEEAPKEVLSEVGDSVDLYQMVSLSWRAVQELSDEVEYLKNKLKNR